MGQSLTLLVDGKSHTITVDDPDDRGSGKGTFYPITVASGRQGRTRRLKAGHCYRWTIVPVSREFDPAIHAVPYERAIDPATSS